ncbi:hypothetical protein TM4_81 [Mycobacterium phage TM4]|uniref:Uncharacterized protein n=1 Tax=Mycobacterium phage TM4 TaxID=88870 RepID=Q9ZWZ9_BPMT4|nr:hypothetical protein TM4_gp81 [Mycobacterium phage TM4]AAD17646.1 hypothetical protein TM4_81 [Mycobacterium phage TM4]
MMTDAEFAARLDEIEAAREREYQEHLAAERAKGNHIRKRAGRSLGNQWYSHQHRVQFIEGYVDPLSQTLCGADATIFDQSWADTRWPKHRAEVTCQACIDARLADPKARR